MGTLLGQGTGLGNALFSKTQQQVLGLLIGNPDRSYYTKEIVRHANVGIGTVQRELEKLSGAGILTVRNIGNQKHYKANRESPIFEELYGIVLKTFGVADTLKRAFQPYLERISEAFIYGSVAGGTDHASSDIDIMIISDDLTYPEIMAAVTQVETTLGRAVNPVLYKRAELIKRIETDSVFVKRVMDQPKIFLIGTEDDLRQFSQSR